MTQEVRVRVAPSPTGKPHVGNATTFLFNYAFARSQGGKFILRIEDTDRTRSRPEYEQAIFDALRWLGLTYDEGPDVGGPCAPYRQSERTDLYRRYADQLIAQDRAYPCFCSPERIKSLRERQQKEKTRVGYDRLCASLEAEEIQRRQAAGEPHVIRLKVPREDRTEFTDMLRGTVIFENAEIDDQVLIKSDGFPTYHLANVVDDHQMRITHVIRAEEWISSTPKHIMLYKAFGWEPPAFAHLSILRNANRAKLKKRDNAAISISDFRDRGYLPEALLNFMALMGYSPPNGEEVFSLDELVSSFTLDRLNTTAPVFDMQKLDWMNGTYIRALPPEELTRRLRDFSPVARGLDDALMAKIAPLAQERLHTLADFEPVTDFFWREITHDAKALVQKKHTVDDTVEMLETIAAGFEAVTDWTVEALDAFARAFTESSGWKVRDLFMTVRVAMTGKTATPPLFESMVVLGRERSLERLRAAITALKSTGEHE